MLERALKFSQSTSQLADVADQYRTGGVKSDSVSSFVPASNTEIKDLSQHGGSSNTKAAKSQLSSTSKITMSTLPKAPRVTSFYASLDTKTNHIKTTASKSMKKKKKKRAKNEKRMRAAASAAGNTVSSHLTDPTEYVNIDPKDKKSPFAPNRHEDIVKSATRRVNRSSSSPVQMHSEDDLDTLNRRMLKMGADSAALDEFSGFVGKRVYMFGGFGIRQKSQAQGVKDGGTSGTRHLS